MGIFENINNIELRIMQIESKLQSLEGGTCPVGSFPQYPVLSFSSVFQGFMDAAESVTHTPEEFKGTIEEAGKEYGIDPALLSAVITQESGFDPHATSSAGAQGLMQLMPETARALGVTDPFDPRQNIFAGARYLRSMMDRFNGNLSMALAAYNAGPNAVKEHGGVPPFKETQNYVSSIMALYGQNRRSTSGPKATPGLSATRVLKEEGSNE